MLSHNNPLDSKNYIEGKDNSSSLDFIQNGISISDLIQETEQAKKEFAEIRERNVNRFPVEVFPESIQEILLATKKTLNFPTDFIGASLLYAASVAIGNTHRIELKKNFQQSAVIYLVLVARSGINKSHPLSWALKPINNNDSKTFYQYEQQLKEYDKIIKTTKKVKEEEGIDEPIIPVHHKFLVTDFTPEAIAQVHKCNKRGIGVHIDELAGWFKNFNRYSKGSEQEFWLSQWSGMAINIDRKTSEPIYIPSPFISVAGTIQPAILNELAKNSRSHNGFIDRLLFVVLERIEKESWSEEDLPSGLSENWESIISMLLNMPVTYDDTLNPRPETLKLTNDAKKLLFEWQIENTNQWNDEESEALCGVISKMDMYVLRLALILELIRYACNESDKKAVGILAVEGAIKLVQYFKESAFKVQSILSINPLNSLTEKNKDIYRELPDVFTTKQGLNIALGHRMPERTFKEWLQNDIYFTRLEHGKYKKT
jgi:hypothetical protein